MAAKIAKRSVNIVQSDRVDSFHRGPGGALQTCIHNRYVLYSAVRTVNLQEGGNVNHHNIAADGNRRLSDRH